MGLANKESILSAIDWDYDEFDVPGWGTVRIRSLSAEERIAIGEEHKAGVPQATITCNLIGLSLVDETGESVFSSDDAHKLLTKNAARLELVTKRILKFNGIDVDDQQELVKN